MQIVRRPATEKPTTHGIVGRGVLTVGERIRVKNSLWETSWRSYRINYRLTRARACHDAFGAVYRRLFTKPIADRTWHARPRYHDAVVADCG